jgi:LCP family protein required for cell wall assembly
MSTEQYSEKKGGVKWLNYVVLGAFLVVAGLIAYLTFVAVRDLVSSWQITDLPGIAIQDAGQNPGESSSSTGGEAAGVVTDVNTPLQPAAQPTPPPWDGAQRVTMLVMGLDYRDWAAGEGPPRTDTMILFSVDPVSRTAGILTIPRDLWVNIPEFDYGRINTAYQLGEAWDWPNGGGPGLAMETVEALLGVPIDYYAQIDFAAFEKFIDEIGGVEVDITETIVLDPLGDNNTKKLKPGHYTLPGYLALAYARTRKSEGGDFDRSSRQIEVIMSMRERILKYKMLPTLFAKAGTLYNQLSQGIQTNLNLDQAFRLAWLAAQIPQENIKKGIIGPPDQVSFAMSPDGEQQVLKPITDKIRLLRDDIFTTSITPATASMSQEELVKTENARVAVLNGSYTPGLAARTTDFLKSKGVNVTVADNAPQLSTYSEITFYTGKPYTLKFLVDLFGISEFRIKHFYDPASPVDISITLGDDWANNNPMP